MRYIPIVPNIIAILLNNGRIVSYTLPVSITHIVKITSENDHVITITFSRQGIYHVIISTFPDCTIPLIYTDICPIFTEERRLSVLTSFSDIVLDNHYFDHENFRLTVITCEGTTYCIFDRGSTSRNNFVTLFDGIIQYDGLKLNLREITRLRICQGGNIRVVRKQDIVDVTDQLIPWITNVNTNGWMPLHIHHGDPQLLSEWRDQDAPLLSYRINNKHVLSSLLTKIQK